MGGCEPSGRSSYEVGECLTLKRVLVILGRSIEDNTKLQAGLDLALTHVALDLEVWVLMTDGGVCHAVGNDAHSGDWIELLSLYGVERFLAETESLEVQASGKGPLRAEVERIARRQVPDLLRQFELHVAL